MTQTNMTDFVVNEAQAKEIDDLNSYFFSAESNSTYKLTFSKEPFEDKESPDKLCVTGRLVKQMVPVFVDGKKTEQMEEKVLRQMCIDSYNGKPCRKIWRIKSKNMREIFKTYADNNLLSEKIFILEVKGELKQGKYFLTALDKPKN